MPGTDLKLEGYKYIALTVKKIFSWRIVALQCCVGFCQTATSISHKYAYIPSLSSIPPAIPVSPI